jgi:hypothetical protein
MDAWLRGSSNTKRDKSELGSKPKRTIAMLTCNLWHGVAHENGELGIGNELADMALLLQTST